MRFRLLRSRLERLKSRLNAVDFAAAADELDDDTPAGAPSFAVTHRGMAVDLAEDFLDINRGEGSPIAERMFDLLDELDLVIADEPEVDHAVDRHLRIGS